MEPAQIEAGIVPLRRVHDLRHKFATFALRGHLARDGREHAIRLLDSYADIKAADVQAMDVGWTPQLPIVVGHDNANTA